MRAVPFAIGLCLATACAGGVTETRTSPLTSNFTGSWASVTPSLEFVRLSVVSRSDQPGVLGAHVTFSGTAWDGTGRIEGDSLLLQMTPTGSAQPIGSLVARATDAETLSVVVRTGSVSPIVLTLKREGGFVSLGSRIAK